MPGRSFYEDQIWGRTGWLVWSPGGVTGYNEYVRSRPVAPPPPHRPAPQPPKVAGLLPSPAPARQRLSPPSKPPAAKPAPRRRPGTKVRSTAGKIVSAWVITAVGITLVLVWFGVATPAVAGVIITAMIIIAMVRMIGSGTARLIRVAKHVRGRLRARLRRKSAKT